MRIAEGLKALDWSMVAATGLLALIGLAMLVNSELLIRQGLAVAIGVALFLFLSVIPYHVIGRYVWGIWGLGVIGLVAVAFAGPVIRGTVSRFTVFGAQLQPSEFMKVGLILALAAFLARFQLVGWRALLGSAMLVAIPCGLLALEPDIGVGALVLIVWGVMLVFWGLSWRLVIVLLLLAAVAGVGAWQWLLLDYQKARLITFVDPSADPQGRGYNVTQSIIALGSGQILGRGLGHGPQSQLKFLPERHTDFMLASIGEELGFVGVSLVIVLYGVLLWRILKVAAHTRDPFGQLIAVGTFVLLLASFCVSAGMNMGMLPVTGIPLPLVGYGGSSLVSTLLLLGIVQSVRGHSRWLQAHPIEIDQF